MTTLATDSFDFLRGQWNVRHRKLARRLAGCGDWLEFDGRMVSRPLLGGVGNYDDNILNDPSGAYRALTLRRLNLSSNLWSIWWVDARRMRLEPPVHGTFERGLGTFVGDDEFEGRPIRVRFLWSAITESSARWEQAFSPDSGRSWEPNWIMNFKRQPGAMAPSI